MLEVQHVIPLQTSAFAIEWLRADAIIAIVPIFVVRPRPLRRVLHVLQHRDALVSVLLSC